MIVTLEQDENGDLILPLTNELCKEVGWEIGDTISWTNNGDGSWTMTKKKVPTKIVMVDAVQTFRMRYAVEIPEDAPVEQALRTLSESDDKVEFSQEYIGELIASHRVVTPAEFLLQFDIDNDYLAAWTDEQKFNAGLTKIAAE